MVTPDGTAHAGGDGITAAAAGLPWARPLARLAARSPAARRGLQRAYAAVASRRGRLARFVPDRPAIDDLQDSGS